MEINHRQTVAACPGDSGRTERRKINLRSARSVGPPTHVIKLFYKQQLEINNTALCCRKTREEPTPYQN